MNPTVPAPASANRVAAVRFAFDAWNRGDFETLGALYADDATADGGLLWPTDAGVVHGRAAIVARFEDQYRSFESWEAVPEDVFELDRNRTLVAIRWTGVPRGGTQTVVQRLAGLFEDRDGQIVRLAWFGSIDEALNAPGQR